MLLSLSLYLRGCLSLLNRSIPQYNGPHSCCTLKSSAKWIERKTWKKQKMKKKNEIPMLLASHHSSRCRFLLCSLCVFCFSCFLFCRMLRLQMNFQLALAPYRLTVRQIYVSSLCRVASKYFHKILQFKWQEKETKNIRTEICKKFMLGSIDIYLFQQIMWIQNRAHEVPLEIDSQGQWI